MLSYVIIRVPYGKFNPDFPILTIGFSGNINLQVNGTDIPAIDDIDGDGDLDLFVANQNGDTNGLYRNDGGHFVDVARGWGVEAPRKSAEFGGVGAAVADYDVFTRPVARIP